MAKPTTVRPMPRVIKRGFFMLLKLLIIFIFLFLCPVFWTIPRSVRARGWPKKRPAIQSNRLLAFSENPRGQSRAEFETAPRPPARPAVPRWGLVPTAADPDWR